MRRCLFLSMMVLSLLHCESVGHVVYDASGDIAFAASIEGVWRTPDRSTTLTLCENTGPDALHCGQPVRFGAQDISGDEVSCHEIHRGSPGPDQSFEVSDGTTGCNPDHIEKLATASLSLHAELVHPDGRLAMPAAVRVDSLGLDGYAGDTLLVAAGPRESMVGRIDRTAGTIHLSIYLWTQAFPARPAVADAAKPDASWPDWSLTFDLVRTAEPNPCR
jgi:hypothetical protein